MSVVSISAESLWDKRAKVVRRLLSPLLPTDHHAKIQQIGPGRNAFTLGALPPSAVAAPYINPEDPRVATKVFRLFLNYYETWRPDSKGDIYFLDRCYMHIHLQRSYDSKQLLSLHCDPCIVSSEQHYRYKRGPHLHLEGAEPNVDRAHISLCLHDSRLGGDTVDELTSVLREAVHMIDKEMFPCWERATRS